MSIVFSKIFGEPSRSQNDRADNPFSPRYASASMNATRNRNYSSSGYY